MATLHVSESHFQSWRRSRKLGPQLASLPPEERAKKPSKWNNQRCERDGIRFDSQAEMVRYSDLKMLRQAGQIYFLECHPKFTFRINGMKLWTYTADFAYRTQAEELVIEDVKNPANSRERNYLKNVKMMQALYGIRVRTVVTGERKQ